MDALDVPEPFDLDGFCHRLGQQRNRPIRLLPLTTGVGTPCGIWVSAAEADYIFHEQGTSILHQQHIVLHEIGHMLLEHGSGPGPAGGRYASLLPDLDPELITTMLGRTAYDCVQELEAETFADLMSLAVTPATARYGRSAPAAPREHAEIVARIEGTVGVRGTSRL
ncbi:hypothetical protein [Actinomadura rubrisoli]|uniref:ImmA/IrrE family metallo-endopeptidase n=1 Tax=Actinomadura rubrisoli TaxID=2530368 RepID=A0A4R5BZM5_9ACTN|nr:hypothetical protein [Actinomadura rubrisoli]TDD91845.1 hypothetical protein E1298_11400 [Actinomadura rubrisoli]